MSAVLETIPLTEQEKKRLLDAYKAKRGRLLIVYAILIVLAVIPDYRVSYTDHGWRMHHADGRTFETYQTVAISLFWLFSIIVISTYHKIVRNYKRDIQNGIKNCVPYTIVRKLYAEHSCQYFLGVNNPVYLRHEVDSGTYYQYSEGDTIFIYRASLSRYMFDSKGKYSVL